MLPNFSALDHQHMALALQYAERGLNTTRPNPRVGCVLAHGDQVVGAGFHLRAGEPHAEVHALRAAGSRALGATAYVTLEPCAHTGRTGPCADALIHARVARVVVAVLDPYPEVAGRGLQRLRDAGIVVELGLMAEPARALNAGFFGRIERVRPWLRIKLAASLDGRTGLANGSSTWITGEPARADVQAWRARSCAILTGVGTVLTDNPRLDLRAAAFADAPAPLKVVLDRKLRTPPNAQLLRTRGQTLLAHSTEPSAAGANLAAQGALLWQLPEAPDAQLPALLQELARRGINEVQVEAGAKLSGALLSAGLVDELLLYQAPCLLGPHALPLFELAQLQSMSERWRFACVERRLLGDDLRTLWLPA